MFIAQNEAEFIRLSRIVEEENEKLRVQRVTNEEQERLFQAKIKEEEILRQKQIAIDEEEHIKKVKITEASYEVEIKIEESKLEWLRQDWEHGAQKDRNQQQIMDNLQAQLDAAEKARDDAENMKQQEWERAKAMMQDGLNERRKVDSLADATEAFL